MNGVRRSELTWGERAVVFGAGLLGQFTARICRLAGTMPVFVSDISEERLSCLPEDPAIVRVNPGKNALIEVLKSFASGELADVGFELTGRAALIHDELTALRRRGRLVLLSSPRDKVEFDFHDDCNYISSRIIGAHVGSHPLLPQPEHPWTRNRHAEAFFDMLKLRMIDVKPLITQIASVDEAPEIYRAIAADRGKYMGILFDWQ